MGRKRRSVSRKNSRKTNVSAATSNTTATAAGTNVAMAEEGKKAAISVGTSKNEEGVEPAVAATSGIRLPESSGETPASEQESASAEASVAESATNSASDAATPGGDAHSTVDPPSGVLQETSGNDVEVKASSEDLMESVMNDIQTNAESSVASTTEESAKVLDAGEEALTSAQEQGMGVLDHVTSELNEDGPPTAVGSDEDQTGESAVQDQVGAAVASSMPALAASADKPTSEVESAPRQAAENTEEEVKASTESASSGATEVVANVADAGQKALDKAAKAGTDALDSAGVDVGKGNDPGSGITRVQEQMGTAAAASLPALAASADEVPDVTSTSAGESTNETPANAASAAVESVQASLNHTEASLECLSANAEGALSSLQSAHIVEGDQGVADAPSNTSGDGGATTDIKNGAVAGGLNAVQDTLENVKSTMHKVEEQADDLLAQAAQIAEKVPQIPEADSAAPSSGGTGAGGLLGKIESMMPTTKADDAGMEKTDDEAPVKSTARGLDSGPGVDPYAQDPEDQKMFGTCDTSSCVVS